jgi:branched-chain amino acid transport system ATP-binding protein
VRYGPLEAVRGISFEVHEGQIVALIGSNGAGKSTTLKALMGLVEVAAGSIRMEGNDLNAEAAALRVTRGLAMSPEGRRLFGRMTVLDNLLVGAHSVKARSDIDRSLKDIYTLFPRVYERRAQLAGSLSGGEQQMVAISRALMARPRLLMLDEPSLGIAPKIVAEIASAIERLNRDAGMSIVLVEQNARLALKLAHQAYALEHGEIVRTGKGAELLADPFVRKAYLGV